MPQNGPYTLKNDTIILDRVLNPLDLFVKQFIDTLAKHTDYLIVSGYVSICTGRTRGTEDIDIIIQIMDKNSFLSLFKDLKQSGFWCYQGDDPAKVHEYVKNLTSVRFALKDKVFPNIELIPFNDSKKAKKFEFDNPQKISIQDFSFKIPPIEFEILYKEIILGSKKDIEDARHLRRFFAKLIKTEKFKRYEPILRNEIS